MKLLTIDYETKDPYISMKLGAGWAYEYNIPDSLFQVLGAAIREHDGTTSYVTDWGLLLEILKKHDAILAHNATYELGILHCLYGKEHKSVLDNLKVFDTKLLFKLYDNTLLSYSLDSLAKRYIREPKGHKILIQAVWRNGLYPWLKKELNEKTRSEKKGLEYIRPMPEDKKILKFAYENMDLIQRVDPKAMAEYAIKDIDITYALYQFLSKTLNKTLADKFSYLSHICVQYRLKGVRVDLKRAEEIYFKMIPLIAEESRKIYEIAGSEFNINSSVDLPPVFDKLGIKYPLTAAGNASVTSPWLATQTHIICKHIIQARKYKKIQGDFIKKIINMQKHTCPGAKDYGKIYPELNILEARTGRFSSSNPNIQQIPTRDTILGPLCRSIFVPFEGESWYSLDFSNQEGRLLVHYASELGCEGADELRLEFNKNPRLDMHQRGADIAGISRKEAKGIVLGIMYGMGIEKLADSLSLNVRQAKLLKEKYDNMLPFLGQLNTMCRKVLRDRGYIKTLSGRFSKLDSPLYINGSKKTFEYKALNKLIQGSAADQTIEAMIEAYKQGIPVLFPVHDELCMSGTREQAEELKVIMENAVQLSVPMVADIQKGNNWAEVK